jgi:hypothetical protein
MINCRHLAAVTVFAAALVACGGDSEPKAARAPAARSTADGGGDGAAASDPTRGMVRGVSAGKQGELVDLMFELKARPQVGEPLTIEVAMIPRVSSEQMRATFIATDGLTVRPSNAPPEYRNVQADSVFRQDVVVVPKADGVYYLSAVILLHTETGDVSRTFSIPVLVGPPPDDSAGTAAPPANAGGQSAESPSAPQD